MNDGCRQEELFHLSGHCLTPFNILSLILPLFNKLYIKITDGFNGIWKPGDAIHLNIELFGSSWASCAHDHKSF